MNCTNCGRLVYPNQTKCPCGTKVIRPYQPPSTRGRLPNPSAEVSRAYGRKLDEINAYVERYRHEHPDATKCTACLAYLKERGLMGALPNSLRRTVDAEARIEREAIQAEANP